MCGIRFSRINTNSAWFLVLELERLAGGGGILQDYINNVEQVKLTKPTMNRFSINWKSIYHDLPPFC